jgi:hypothetical protein
MRGSWWTWLSAVLAIILGLVFGWVAGTGVVHADAAAPAVAVMDAGGLGPSAAGSGGGS